MEILLSVLLLYLLTTMASKVNCCSEDSLVLIERIQPWLVNKKRRLVQTSRNQNERRWDLIEQCSTKKLLKNIEAHRTTRLNSRISKVTQTLLNLVYDKHANTDDVLSSGCLIRMKNSNLLIFSEY